MPRYVVSALIGHDVDQVVNAMRRAGANIIGVNPTPRSKITSGRFILECSEELALQLQKITGVEHFEKEILHHPVSR